MDTAPEPYQLCTRAIIEAREDSWLAPWAMRSAASRGRKHDEPKDGNRTDFQRDRDRVIHSTAFRRLEHKTQVFLTWPGGDHFRSRLTHSLEVSQISRSIARALRLNEDLTEAVALAHDLGHTPFGHSGSDALDAAMKPFGGFEHNHQSLRIVEELENHYPRFRGLNLTWEVRESIVKHKRPFEGPVYEAYEPSTAPLIEAQVADMADSIAYNTHDLDDGLRAGILTDAMVESTALWRRADAIVAERFGALAGRARQVKIVGQLIHLLVTDLMRHTMILLERNGIRSVRDVRAAKEPLTGFSPGIAREEQELRSFLYREFYTDHRVARMRYRAKVIIEGLFRAYRTSPELLPPRFRALAREGEPARVVADYIAGMTDRYAQEEYGRLFSPPATL